MWRSQQVVILLLLVDWSILLLHLKGWSFDHFETRINIYMIKGYRRIEKRFRTEGFGVQEVRKFCGMNQYLKGQKLLFWSVPVPLIGRPVPLKLRGPPSKIKGAAPSERWNFLSFCGEGFSGSTLPFLVKNLNSYIYNELNIFF